MAKANRSYHLERRHFECIAEIIRKELDGECREKAAYAFAYILPTTNGRFNPQRFLRACEVKAFCKECRPWTSKRNRLPESSRVSGH